MDDGIATALVPCLIFRVGSRLCALPLDGVIETLRPLPLDPLPAAPDFVRGLSLIRGAPTPVVDAAALFGEADAAPTRLITVAAGERTVALAVAGAIDIRTIERAALHALPPLLRNAVGTVVQALGVLDAALLLLLDGAHIVPDAVFDTLAEVHL